MKRMPSSSETAAAELAIMNSQPAFNRLSKGEERFTLAEIEEEMAEARRVGAERFLLVEENKHVGIIEWLMLNPNDGYPWLGLLVVHRDFRRKGFGAKAFDEYLSEMRRRGVEAVRLGVLVGNDDAAAFWRGQGLAFVQTKKTAEGKDVDVYERRT